MYRAFRNDAQYLSRYHFRLFIALLAIAGCAIHFTTHSLSHFLLCLPGLALLSSTYLPTVAAGTVYLVGTLVWSGDLEPWHILFIPLAAATQLVATGILHNAGHDNIRPRKLREPIGELFAFIQMVGFRDWVVVHTLHHTYADDPENDPHPPMGKGYWRYTLGMRDTIVKVLVKDYFKYWGNNPASQKNLRIMGRFSRMNHWLKILIWWAILPSPAFALFFAASVPFKMLHYAWFNYATHSVGATGATILNLDSPVYKVANALSFGLYFHKNHHLNPRLFDPRRMKPATPVPVQAIQPAKEEQKAA